MYILHCHSQTCTGCNRRQLWSHLYAAQTKGNGIELLPVKMAPGPDAAIFTTYIPPTTTPVCHLCIPVDAATRGAQAQAAWELTKRNKAQEARSPAPAAKKPLPPISTLA